MARWRVRVPRPRRSTVTGLLGPDPQASVETVLALVAAVIGSVIAGVTLGAISDTLDRLPGLLLLVPAAVGLRGAIFGTLGSRLGTLLHTGQFTLSLRANTAVGQNVLAVGAVSLIASCVLGVVAKAVATTFGLSPSIGVADYIVISVAAGLASAVVLTVMTVLVSAGGARWGWDLDNVTAPVVTAFSDMITLPFLFAATPLARLDVVTPTLAAFTVVAAVWCTWKAWVSHLDAMRRIVQESVGVLAVAGAISLVAGVTLEQRIDRFTEVPALLVLVPPFLASGGALVGILSSRLGSKLHLGMIEPRSIPGREARSDILRTYRLGIPLFVLVAAAVNLASGLTGLASPGTLDLAGVALFAAAIAVTTAVGVAYLAAVLTFRLGLDPDNFGIPLVTASMDLVGAFALIVAVATLGVA